MTSLAVDVPASAVERTDRPSETNRIRVCHLSTTLDTGGLERLLVDHARLGDAERFELSFIALSRLGPPAEELRGLGLQVTSLDLARVGKWQAIRHLTDVLRTRAIDVLHTHNTLPQFYGALAKMRAGVPVAINTQHGRGCGEGWKAKAQFVLANAVADRVLAVSEESAALCRRQDGWHSRRIGCIPNGVDLERFPFRGPADSSTALFVGRLAPEKDVATLLHATAQIAWKFPEFRLRIAGDGSERAPLEKLARQIGIRRRVEFLGECGNVNELLGECGFFVSSSTTEGTSITLLEAMAVGLPVVTTAVGGSPEIVVDGITGRLVPPRDPQRLAQAIAQVLCERDLWHGMGEAGRRRVERHFNIRDGVARYAALYKELLAKKSGLRGSRAVVLRGS